MSKQELKKPCACFLQIYEQNQTRLSKKNAVLKHAFYGGTLSKFRLHSFHSIKCSFLNIFLSWTKRLTLRSPARKLFLMALFSAPCFFDTISINFLICAEKSNFALLKSPKKWKHFFLVIIMRKGKTRQE